MSTPLDRSPRRSENRLPIGLVQVAFTVALLPWLIQPGVVQPDTKVDLVVSPGRYLSRAFSAWSGHSGFGELQNQAYGYLFPMGPLFRLGNHIGLPAWATQRLWWSVLLFVSCLGASLVARRVLGVRPLAAATAGLLFALSPRVLMLLSELSVEAWPGALLPWFVLTVHAYGTGRLSGRRFAAIVGVLAMLCGGVNATASLVPIAGGGLFLILRGGRWRGIGWYALGALAGAAWWLGPLLVLGHYAYPFMDYIETSHITTAVTSVPGILRGASDWVAYIIDASDHPVWQSGWVVAQSASSIIGGLALAGVGLLGLSPRRRRPSADDAFRGARARCSSPTAFAGLLLVGVLVMGVPYIGAVSGPFAEAARHLLDGPLAAARNVHKADPLVRLPLVLGVALFFDRLRARRVCAGIAAGAVACAAFGSWAPFWQGRLGDAQGVRAFPSSLREVARAVDDEAAQRGGSTFVVPSARSASFEWGTMSDEPLTAFAASPVAWRASAPLVHPGVQCLMDAADGNIAAGHDLTATAAALSRAGVRRIVVRHGLTAAEQVPDSATVVTHLLSAPRAFTHHRVFGSGSSRYDLFDVVGPGPLPAAQPIGVLGGPESTISLAAAGVQPGRPYAIGTNTGWITDDVRKRVYNNGRSVAVAFGPTLPSYDRSDAKLGSRDLVFPGRDSSLTTLGLFGVDSLTASNSAADPFGRTYLGPGAGPASSMDGDRNTAWLVPAQESGTLQLGWSRGTRAPMTFGITPATTGGARITGWQVRIDQRVSALSASAHPTFRVPAHTKTVSITPTVTGGGTNAAGGISELTTCASNGPCTQPVAAPLLPGRVDPMRNGVVLSHRDPAALGHPLRSEDGTIWTRALRVARAGDMTVHVQPQDDPRGSCRGATVEVASAPGQPFRPVPGGGCTRNISLAAGTDLLRLSGSLAARVILVPRDATAQARLGWQSGIDSGPGYSGAGAGSPAQGQSGDLVTATTTGADAGWKSSTGARATVVDGWQQGFLGRVPKSSVTFAPQRFHVLALSFGALTAALCVLGALWPDRRRGGLGASQFSVGGLRPTARSRVGAWVPIVGAGLLDLVLAGWWGLATFAVGILVPRAWRGLGAAICVALAGPAMATLGVVDHASIGAFVGQLLGVAGVTMFLLAFSDEPRRWPAARRTSKRTTQAPD